MKKSSREKSSSGEKKQPRKELFGEKAEVEEKIAAGKATSCEASNRFANGQKLEIVLFFV
ncbi:MAG: hypothetical protein J6X86_07680 [Bacteroidales bacterium]|nr:hypothetical protein [Bacteroidales bacterium]